MTTKTIWFLHGLLLRTKRHSLTHPLCISLSIHPSSPPDEELSLLRNLTQALSVREEQYVLKLANSLFLQQGVHFNPDFLHLMKKYFRAEVQTVDFGESAAVAERINSWVENHTESE